ncbi:hypothetical protein Bca4012_065765 [Brassica carinata]
MDLAVPPDDTDPPGVDLSNKESLIEAGKIGSEGDQKILGQSWVTATMDKKRLRKYEVEVLHSEGIHTVEIPEGIMDNTTPLWEDFIIGKFLDISPHVAKIHMVLNKIWKYGDSSIKVEVYEVNSTTMRFKVSSLKAREKILHRGMWNILGVPMIVSKWALKAEDDEQEDSAIPMWVHLEKVPLHMYSWEGLSFITSAVGLPVKPHQDTIACTKLDEAKIFVKVDVSKVLPKEITFTKDGKSFTVSFYYPWLPARCKVCDKWGHGEAVCGAKGKGKRSSKGTPRSSVKGEVADSEGNTKERSSVTPLSTAKGEVAGKDSGTSVINCDESQTTAKGEVARIGVRIQESRIGSPLSTVKGEVAGNVASIQERRSTIYHTGGLNTDKKEERSTGYGSIAGGSATKAWTTVSLAKTGRSLFNSPQVTDVAVLTSKFSVLSLDEIEEGEVLEEANSDSLELVELEVNESVDPHEEEVKEDTAIEQQLKEEIKVGKRRGRRLKAQDGNPGKSSRPVRRKH